MGSQTNELSQSLRPTELIWIQVFTGKKESCVAILLPVLGTGLPNHAVTPAYAEFYNSNLVCAHSFTKILVICVQPSKRYWNHTQNFLQLL